MPLTDVAIRAAKPAEKPRKLFDAQGLYLEIAPAGGRWWRFRYRWGGREKRISLGTYPAVSLLEARRKRDDALRLLEGGVDPSAARRSQKMERAAKARNSFEYVARQWHASWQRTRSPKHAAQVWRRLEQDVLPIIGSLPITQIRAPDVVATARRAEARGAHDIARRNMQICAQVFRFAIGHGMAEHNPARDVEPNDVLQPVRHLHYRRVSPERVPALLQAINEYRGHPRTRLALHLMSLVFLRTGELIATPLAEVQAIGKDGRWHIPAARMKMPSPHVVPLSRQARAVLDALIDMAGDGRWLLPGNTDHEAHMSNNAILYALYRMGFRGEMTGHGFRGVASTALHEAGFEHAHIEAQLAHQKRNAVSAAYDWSQYLSQRAKMMQWWADWLDRQRGAPIII